MFDKLDSYFQSEQEREKFYETYVFAMLNVYGNIENLTILWEMKTEKLPTMEYPRFNKDKYITFLETDMTASNKETALWFSTYLNKKYIAEKTNVKRQTK